MKYIFAAALTTLTLAWFGPLLDRIDEGVTAAQAANEQRARDRFERAARQMCGGENSSFTELENGVIQCKTKRNHNTIRISMEDVK